ncbi:MAG: hypothetical protein AAFY15_00170 [Cyanobacteria bacterium J06648_11]
MALLSVLWVTLLIAALVSAFLVRVQGFALSHSTWEQRVRAALAIDHATARFLSELSRPRSRVAVPESGQFDLDEFSIEVTVQRASGLVDINKADIRLLAALFAAFERDRGRAEQIASAVVDWRDPDKLRGPGGAEGDSYVSAGVDYVPRNAPFQSVAELSLVLGMSPELYRCVAEFVTVSSRSPLLELQHAPEALAALLQDRGAGGSSGISDLLVTNSSGSVVNPSSGSMSGSVYALRFSASSNSGFQLQRRVWVRVTENRRRPYEIMQKEVVWTSSDSTSDCPTTGAKT